MRQRSLYAALRCVVHPAKLDVIELLAMKQCLLDGGATILESSNAASSSAATHIICHPEAYQNFVDERNERFVALVRPEWVFRTFLLQQLLPVDRFSSNPALIFSTLAISAGAIGKDPRKVINGLITHFGGQIVDQKEVYGGATHILHHEDNALDPFVAVDLEGEECQKLWQLKFSKADLGRSINAWRLHLSTTSAGPTYALPSCVVAYLGQRAGLNKQYYIKHTWIEECVMRQTRVPEEPFACKASEVAAIESNKKLQSWKTQPEVQLDDLNFEKWAQVYHLGRTELGSDLSMVRKLSNEKIEEMKKTLHGAIVLLAQHIAPLLRAKLSNILKTVDAKVANVPFGDAYQDIVSKVVTNASVIVCRYCSGFEYNEALRQGKKVVSIYWVLAGLLHTSNPTLYNQAIQRPVQSFGSIHGMQNFVVTLSGYSSKSSPTREEVQIAIHATGACLLPVLSRTYSTHLLCYEASGEKYKKALSWNLDNVLSHEWIFACLSKWEYVSELAFRYNSNNGMLGDTDSTALDHSSKKKGNEELNYEEEIANKTKLATKPRLRSPKKAKKNGEERFDVDEILSEIDKVPTPSDRKSPANLMTPTTIPKVSTKVPNCTNSTPCTLFDTPTNTSLSSISKRKTRKTVAEKAIASVNEIEKEPATIDMTTDASAAKEAALVISVDSDSNADEVGTLEAVTTIASNEELEMTRQLAEELRTKKRKLADSKESKTFKSSRASLKKHKKGPAAAKKSRAVSSPQVKRVFLLTGDRDQAAVQTRMISSLGGSVSDFGRVYDSSCTHIICSELKRTEKFVAGCAAGKWILHPSYLEACSAAGEFLDEIAYEWGSHKADTKEIDMRIWPRACIYWRKKRQDGHAGAFFNWRFFIHAKSVPPRDMCERIILAGGGSVIPLTKTIDYKSLSEESTTKAPVVALFPPDISTRDPLMKKLKAHDIECIKALFLIDSITKSQSPPVKRADYQL